MIALSSKALTQAEIPFREGPAVSGTQAILVLSVTLLLLAGLWLAAQYARRKGWLERWVSRQTSDDSKPVQIRILASRRVSRFTTLHTVTDGDNRYLLVESKANASIIKLDQRTDIVAGEGNIDG